MARTQKSLDANLSKLTTAKKRKVRSDKKPVFIKVKSDAKWELGNGNGNIKNTFPWYLHPVKKDHFNKSCFRDYDDTCKHIKRFKLKPEQYTGGSITVSNLGMFGISEFAAIISPPQASILAVGKIIQKPVVVNESIEIGHTLKSTLSADHRVLDGAVAGKLLKDFNDIIEDPFQIWMQSNDMEII